MRSVRHVVPCFALLLVGTSAYASQNIASNTPASFGSGTTAWLELQRSGQQAAPLRTLPGEVGSRIYRRYLDSFEYPIPELYESKERFGSQSR